MSEAAVEHRAHKLYEQCFQEREAENPSDDDGWKYNDNKAEAWREAVRRATDQLE